MNPYVAGLMAGGTALSIFGNIKSNMDEAAAYRQNIMWLGEQQRFMDRSTARQKRLLTDQSNAVIGEQATIAGASGLEMTGSVMDVMSSTYAAAQDELMAIEDNAIMQRMQMNLDIRQQSKKAKRLSSFGWNLLQSATIATNSAAGAMNSGALTGFGPKRKAATSTRERDTR